jgi:hypothetical protein
MNELIFIAPAAGRQPNPKHFLGYTPGGEGGGTNYSVFPDFGRLSFELTPQCLPITPSANSVWNTGWRVMEQHSLRLRAQMHQVARFLENHPLSFQEHERLIDLAASGPLSRRKIDSRLECLGLVESYDGLTTDVECTELFHSQAYGQYKNLPYDGGIKLPYVSIHGILEEVEA